MDQPRRALVVGGGIGGLSAAIALRMVGFDVEVFEQSPALREVGAGIALWSNAMASLDQLGAAASIRKSCIPVRTFEAANSKGRMLSSMKLDELGPELGSSACYVVLRPMLLAALAERVPHRSIHTGCRAVRAETVQDRVRLHMEGGGVEEGDLLVGADGLHSMVRPRVAGQDEIRYSGQTCFRGVARHRADAHGVIREVQGRGNRGAVFPVDPETSYWWVAFNAPRDRILPESERKQALVERFSGWPFGIGEAIAATPEGTILQNDLVDRPPASNYAKGNLVLVGDAAHPTTPNLGQGANMAIDDAIVLARRLRETSSVPMALREYQRERIWRTRRIVTRSWSYGSVCRWESAAAVALRELMVRMTPKAAMRRILKWQVLDGVGRL